MRSKRHITLIFLVACIAMVAANALPHHHHRAAACFAMNHEAHASLPAHQNGPQEEAPCHTACITKFHCYKGNTGHGLRLCTKAQANPAGIAAATPGGLPHAAPKSPAPPYCERLHPSAAASCRSPRAPPAIL